MSRIKNNQINFCWNIVQSEGSQRSADAAQGYTCLANIYIKLLLLTSEISCSCSKSYPSFSFTFKCLYGLKREFWVLKACLEYMILYEIRKENARINNFFMIFTCLNFWETDADNEIWEVILRKCLQKCSDKKSPYAYLMQRRHIPHVPEINVKNALMCIRSGGHKHS